MSEASREKSTSAPAIASVHCLGSSWDSAVETPCSLLPFLNRPFIHHVIERLVLQGFKEIDVVCHRRAAAIEQCLGSGARWGALLRYLQPLGDDAVGEPPRERYRCSVSSHAMPHCDSEHRLDEIIRIDSPTHYLESQELIMRRGLEEFLTFEQRVHDDQWRGRGIRIHPSAIIQGPSLIGDNVRIGAGVFVGPYSVIGPNCVISRDVSLRRSTVMPGVYVGEGLALSDSILCSDRLFHVRLQTSVPIRDRLVASRV